MLGPVRRWGAAALLGAFAGCFDDSAVLGLPCAADRECGSGYACVLGSCRDASEDAESVCSDDVVDPGDFCYFEADAQEVGLAFKPTVLLLDLGSGPELDAVILSPKRGGASDVVQIWHGSATGLVQQPAEIIVRGGAIEEFVGPQLQIRIANASNLVSVGATSVGVAEVEVSPFDLGGDPITALVYLETDGTTTTADSVLEGASLGESHLLVGDFDCDAKVDLLAIPRSGPETTAMNFLSDIATMHLDGLDAAVVPFPGRPEAQVADINRDGCDEVLTVHDDTSDGGTVAVTPGTPDFVTAPVEGITRAVARGPRLAVADANGDERIDLVVGHSDDEEVHIFHAAPEGLATKAEIHATPVALSIAVGLLDGDEIADLVITNDDGTHLLPGYGTEYGAPLRIAGAAKRVATGDFGRGRAVDVATIDLTDATGVVRVFYATPDGPR